MPKSAPSLLPTQGRLARHIQSHHLKMGHNLMGTEPKSPREIAEDGITDLDAANYAIDYFSWWMTWEQERANKAEAYAAERERLLAEADETIDCLHPWPVQNTMRLKWFEEARERHRLRSLPATEGKDAPR